jgi:hypothetical protein
MEPELSFLSSREPATGPYLEPHESTPTTPSYLVKIHFNIILPRTSRSS